MDFLGSFGGFKDVAISSPHQSSPRRAVTTPKSDWRDSTSPCYSSIVSKCNKFMIDTVPGLPATVGVASKKNSSAFC
ncbi:MULTISPECIES: hypothetical protein [Rhizobium]|uniref:hypothetical protein n=1 Tax=Rhizobium TaxID=379 RepID=UPI00119E5E89|nr:MULTISPECIES: hypothetical protein [Rhizobium]MCZ3379187.1 hypothetical protein [Rhizobium sp. AG207R]